MIQNESEYQQAIKRIEEEKVRLAEHCKAWKKQGYTAKHVKKIFGVLIANIILHIEFEPRKQIQIA